MLNLIKYLIEIAGWIRIVASPFILASGIGAYIYFRDSGPVTLAGGITLSVAGLLTGILWANRVWKKTGTTEFLSRIESTPELNKSHEKQY